MDHRRLAPPTQPRIDFTGDPPEVARDADGIAIGGIRLPQVEAPIAQNSAIPVAADIFSVLYGSSVPFPPAELAARYGDPATFLARFEEAAGQPRRPPARDVQPLIDEARAGSAAATDGGDD